ncbi:uncharacterized protein ColSpa_07437 [Colletotrichum spaethianum]|uniref:Uncharacterized protein n=1 Tax=Colletotrichum spaethianum TaxID=700344 RepID=A0AA37P6T0_9PEZI|nr:uncharacterized protein ColSpa_07437 [Colletotrichum spaethianum]GKT47256.1 hypothetical protein ColSpa_07437 [Colletotrichum spaethianum]
MKEIVYSDGPRRFLTLLAWLFDRQAELNRLRQLGDTSGRDHIQWSHHPETGNPVMTFRGLRPQASDMRAFAAAQVDATEKALLTLLMLPAHVAGLDDAAAAKLLPALPLLTEVADNVGELQIGYSFVDHEANRAWSRPARHYLADRSSDVATPLSNFSTDQSPNLSAILQYQQATNAFLRALTLGWPFALPMAVKGRAAWLFNGAGGGGRRGRVALRWLTFFPARNDMGFLSDVDGWL